jgi:CheY-like chemotaxis protein
MSPRPIDLLITDSLTKQRLNGASLAIALTRLPPDLKVLFVSGYANAELTGPIRLERGQSYLQKPFWVADRAQRIRELRDAQ